MKEYDIEYAYAIFDKNSPSHIKMKIANHTVIAQSFVGALLVCEQFHHFNMKNLRKVEYISQVEVQDDHR